VHDGLGNRRGATVVASAGSFAQVRSLPTFAVDPAWPNVPDKWKLGDPSSFAIDAQDERLAAPSTANA
jgi:hypothetical protein